jgi:hypothetical protein
MTIDTSGNRNEPSSPDSSVAVPAKPTALRTLAILVLISGMMDCLLGVVWVFPIVTAPLSAYCIWVGVRELKYAAAILPDPVLANEPARGLATMQIVNLATGSVWSFVVGILSHVYYRNPAVLRGFRGFSEKGPS